MYKLYNILGNAGIDEVEIIPNPSPSTGKEYLFQYHCSKTISTTQKNEAKTVLDDLITTLTISDPNGELSAVTAERNSIQD